MVENGRWGPAEVVILNVEILLACAPLVVLVYDLFFGAVMVVGQYGTVHVFHTGQELLSMFRIHLGALYYKPQMPVGKEFGEFK